MTADIEHLKSTLRTLYGEEINEEAAYSFRLNFNTNTNLFNEAEKKANTKLESLTFEVMKLIRDLSDELNDIIRKQHNIKDYKTTLIEGTDKGYDRLFIRTDKILQSAEKLSETLQKMAKSLQPIACKRYFKKLTPREIINEASDISDGFVVVPSDISQNEFDNDFYQKLAQALKTIGAVNLLNYYNNDYYTLRLNAILPSNFKDLTEEKLREFIKDTAEPCFSAHFEALKERKYPSKEINTFIENAVNIIYKDLNISFENAEVTKGKRQKPIESYFLPHTAITKILFDGSPLKGKSEIPIRYYTDPKTRQDINIYLSVIQNLKDVKGLESYGLEELGILSGLFTRILNGDKRITPLMVKKGQLMNTKVAMTEKELENYIRVINDFRDRDITIDQRELIGKIGRNGEKITDPYRTGKIFKADILTPADIDGDPENVFKICGQEVKIAWEVDSYGPLLEFILFSGQYSQLPAEAMRIEGLRIDEAWIRDFWLNEIHRIKSDSLNTETDTEKEERIKREKKRALEEDKEYKERKPKQQPVVTFEALYNKAKKYPERTRDKEKIQRVSQLCLNKWKSMGIINNYKCLKDGMNRKTTKKEDKRKKPTLLDAIEIDVKKSTVETL